MQHHFRTPYSSESPQAYHFRSSVCSPAYKTCIHTFYLAFTQINTHMVSLFGMSLRSIHCRRTFESGYSWVCCMLSLYTSTRHQSLHVIAKNNALRHRNQCTQKCWYAPMHVQLCSCPRFEHAWCLISTVHKDDADFPVSYRAGASSLWCFACWLSISTALDMIGEDHGCTCSLASCIRAPTCMYV